MFVAMRDRAGHDGEFSVTAKATFRRRLAHAGIESAQPPENMADRLLDAPAALVPSMYQELRRLAHHDMRGERAGHTLRPTAR